MRRAAVKAGPELYVTGGVGRFFDSSGGYQIDASFQRRRSANVRAHTCARTH